MANEIQADYASGSTLYAVLRDGTGQVWHSAQQVFESWGAGGRTAADYALALLDKNGNRYVGDFDPAVPAGDYGIQVFRQSGAAPADTDPFVSGRRIRWTGTGELTATKILANKAVQDRVAGILDYYDNDGQTVLFTHAVHDDGAISTRSPD